MDVYNTQKAVNQQHAMLDKKKDEFMKVINERDKITALLNSEKNTLKEKSSVYFDIEKKGNNSFILYFYCSVIIVCFYYCFVFCILT